MLILKSVIFHVSKINMILFLRSESGQTTITEHRGKTSCPFVNMQLLQMSTNKMEAGM